MPRVIAVKMIASGLALLFLPLFSLEAFAQGETTSAIVGLVSDASGAAVPGATVTIHNTEAGLQRIATSPPTGLIGVGLGGDSTPRMIAFQMRVEF
jgi:hypothetical protein